MTINGQTDLVVLVGSSSSQKSPPDIFVVARALSLLVVDLSPLTPKLSAPHFQQCLYMRRSDDGEFVSPRWEPVILSLLALRLDAPR